MLMLIFDTDLLKKALRDMWDKELKERNCWLSLKVLLKIRGLKKSNLYKNCKDMKIFAGKIMCV